MLRRLYFCFVFARSWFHMSAQRQANIPKAPHSTPQVLQANYGIVHQISSRLLKHPFQILIH
jgi:hypothetical protein